MALEGLKRACPSEFISMPIAVLRAMGVDLEEALERVNVPSYVIDRDGVVRWMNEAARSLVGDQVGRQFTSVVAPEETRRAREIFARKVVGNSEVTDAAPMVVDAEGEYLSVEISSVPLRRGDHVVGVFGQVSDVLEEPHAHPELAPDAEASRGVAVARARSLDRADCGGAGPESTDGAEPH